MIEEDVSKELSEDRRALLDALFQLTKWVIATLILLNGAAALTTVGRLTLDPLVASIVALMFVSGILSALAAALALVIALISSYALIMHRVRPLHHLHYVMISITRMLAAVVVLLSAGLSVGEFTNGVKALANASISNASNRSHGKTLEPMRSTSERATPAAGRPALKTSNKSEATAD